MSRQIGGAIDFGAGVIGNVPFSTIARNSGETLDTIKSLARQFDGKSFSEIRKLPASDPLRKSADKLLKIEKAQSFATRASSVKNAVKKIGKLCTDNKALCAGLGVAGYLAYDSYGKLKKEKKECLNVCIPDDWEKFKKGEIQKPTYKLENAVSPYDPEIKYSELYPEHKETVCTIPNMLSDGINPSDKDSCDVFCQNVCDFELTDVLSESAQTAGRGTRGILGGATEGLLPDFGNYVWILGGVIMALIVLFVVLKMM